MRRLLHTLLLLGAAFGALPVIVHAQETITFVKPDTPPVPVKTPPPKHPDNLRRDGVSGIVTVAIIISASGEVKEASINKSTHKDFETPALDAVKRWKFKPAKKDGADIPSKVIVPLHFNLED